MPGADNENGPKSLGDAIAALIVAAAPETGESDLRHALSLFGKALASDPVGIAEADAIAVLERLKSGRHPLEVAQAAQAILQQGVSSPRIEKLLVQGMVDSGFASAAAIVATDVLARIPGDHPERAELTGLLGRCAKDRGLGLPPEKKDLRLQYLKQSIKFYEAAAKLPAPDNGRWPRINAAAIRAFMARRGGDTKQPAAVHKAAKEILAEIKSLPPAKLGSWDKATACEAAVALGDWDQAELWLRRYVEASKDPFELNSTLRQLTTLWEIGGDDPDGGGDRGQALLAALGAAVLSAKHGTIRLDPGYPLPLQKAAYQPTFEAVFGEKGPDKLTWLLDAIERTKSVARIGYGGKGFGTGFLMAADSLPKTFLDAHPEIAGRRILATNAHVVSQPRYRSPDLTGLEPSEVTITFEGAQILQKYAVEHRIEKIIWSSPPSDFDCTLALLDPEPTGIAGLPVSLRVPMPQSERVYVIGHPAGGELSLSLQDNELLDRDDPLVKLASGKMLGRLRYRAPTERGSSGSPVFDMDRWQVVALHHSGGSGIPKLNGGAGFEAANEGITLASIFAALG